MNNNRNNYSFLSESLNASQVLPIGGINESFNRSIEDILRVSEQMRQAGENSFISNSFINQDNSTLLNDTSLTGFSRNVLRPSRVLEQPRTNVSPSVSPIHSSFATSSISPLPPSSASKFNDVTTVLPSNIGIASTSTSFVPPKPIQLVPLTYGQENELKLLQQESESLEFVARNISFAMNNRAKFGWWVHQGAPKLVFINGELRKVEQEDNTTQYYHTKKQLLNSIKSKLLELQVKTEGVGAPAPLTIRKDLDLMYILALVPKTSPFWNELLEFQQQSLGVHKFPYCSLASFSTKNNQDLDAYLRVIDRVTRYYIQRVPIPNGTAVQDYTVQSGQDGSIVTSLIQFQAPWVEKLTYEVSDQLNRTFSKQDIPLISDYSSPYITMLSAPPTAILPSEEKQYSRIVGYLRNQDLKNQLLQSSQWELSLFEVVVDPMQARYWEAPAKKASWPLREQSSLSFDHQPSYSRLSQEEYSNDGMKPPSAPPAPTAALHEVFGTSTNNFQSRQTPSTRSLFTATPWKEPAAKTNIRSELFTTGASRANTSTTSNSSSSSSQFYPKIEQVADDIEEDELLKQMTSISTKASNLSSAFSRPTFSGSTSRAPAASTLSARRSTGAEDEDSVPVRSLNDEEDQAMNFAAYKWEQPPFQTFGSAQRETVEQRPSSQQQQRRRTPSFEASTRGIVPQYEMPSAFASTAAATSSQSSGIYPSTSPAYSSFAPASSSAFEDANRLNTLSNDFYDSQDEGIAQGSRSRRIVSTRKQELFTAPKTPRYSAAPSSGSSLATSPHALIFIFVTTAVLFFLVQRMLQG